MTALKNKIYPADVIPYNAITKQRADLIKAANTLRLRLRLTGAITIAAGTGVGTVLPESLERLINWIRILEGGKPTIEIDPRAAVQIYNLEHEHAAKRTTLANTANQVATAIELAYELAFSSRLLANPYEVAYVPQFQADGSKKFQIEIEWAPDIKAAMSTGNDGTWTQPTAIQLEVEQHFDDLSNIAPIYVPRLRRVESGNIAGLQQHYPLDLQMNARSRGILIHTLSDGLTDGGVITANLELSGSDTYLKRVDPAMIVEDMAGLHPGFDGTQVGYYFLPFAQNGRLGNLFDPTQDPQLKLFADVNKGAGAIGVIRAYDLQLVGVPGTTRVLQSTSPLR